MILILVSGWVGGFEDFCWCNPHRVPHRSPSVIIYKVSISTKAKPSSSITINSEVFDRINNVI